MALLTPLFMQAATGDAAPEYSAQDMRRVFDTMIRSEGILFGLWVNSRAAGANMSVDVASGRCVIEGDDIAEQGKYECTSTAVENRVIPAAPASGSRTHLIVARVKDKLHNGVWTGYTWAIEVVEDTTGVMPDEPASAITLGRVTVSAGQASITNANIVTGSRPYATGIEGRWITWTPQLKAGEAGEFTANIGSTGTATGRYLRQGDTCHFHGHIVVSGTGTSWGGAPANSEIRLTLPFATAGQGLRHWGGAKLFDGTTGQWVGIWEAAAIDNLVKLNFVDGASSGDTDNLNITAAKWPSVPPGNGFQYSYWGTYECDRWA